MLKLQVLNKYCHSSNTEKQFSISVLQKTITGVMQRKKFIQLFCGLLASLLPSIGK